MQQGLWVTGASGWDRPTTSYLGYPLWKFYVGLPFFHPAETPTPSHQLVDRAAADLECCLLGRS